MQDCGFLKLVNQIFLGCVYIIEAGTTEVPNDGGQISLRPY